MVLKLNFYTEKRPRLVLLAKIYQFLEESFIAVAKAKISPEIELGFVIKEVQKNGLVNEFELALDERVSAPNLWLNLMDAVFEQMTYVAKMVSGWGIGNNQSITILSSSNKNGGAVSSISEPELSAIMKFFSVIPVDTVVLLTNEYNKFLKFERKQMESLVISENGVGKSLYYRQDMKYSKFTGQSLHNQNFSESNFSESDFSYTNLVNCEFFDTKLIEANLTGANLSYSDLFKADLTEAILVHTIFENVNFFKASLIEADLTKANLNDALMVSVKLNEANLTEASMQNTNLYSADLREAKISKANLRGANLHNANCSEADMGGVNLADAVLNGVNMTETNLKYSNWWQAKTMNPDLFDVLDKKFPMEENYQEFARLWNIAPEEAQKVSVTVM